MWLTPPRRSTHEYFIYRTQPNSQLYVVNADATAVTPDLADAPEALRFDDDCNPLYEVTGPGPENDGGIALDMMQVGWDYSCAY